jgi:hypothetical protein
MQALANRKPERLIPAPASPPIRKEKSPVFTELTNQKIGITIIKNVLKD